MKNTPYYHQAVLLLRILPIIYRQKDFALKGGTAINFFVHDIPRLSVDIDLVYLPMQSRSITFTKIGAVLEDLALKISQVIPSSSVKQHQKDGYCTKLTISTMNATIKIEPNFTIRGSVYPVVDRELKPVAVEIFETTAKCQSLSDSDLYGGKICAALDRQHPRDLFDIKMLFKNNGITEEIKNAFIFYLLSHNRPIAEVLNPNLKDISMIFAKEFSGMTLTNVNLDELLDTRKQLIKQINSRLNDTDRKFLLSFKSGTPDWRLYPKPEVENYPSIRWKLKNIRRMDKEKHSKAYQKLERLLIE